MTLYPKLIMDALATVMYAGTKNRSSNQRSRRPRLLSSTIAVRM